MATESKTSEAPEFRDSIAMTQSHRDWLLLVAYLHLEQDKPEKAAILLRILLRAYPEDREVLQCLALAELKAGHAQQSARSAIKALKTATPELKLPVGLVFAKSLWQQGKQEAAREFLTSLLQTSPQG